MQYRKKSIVVEAEQWFKVEEVSPGKFNLDVIQFKNRYLSADRECDRCSYPRKYHGWVDTLEGGHAVCPGDWIITGVAGEKYPCKPVIFERTYEQLDGSPVVSKPREIPDENKVMDK